MTIIQGPWQRPSVPELPGPFVAPALAAVLTEIGARLEAEVRAAVYPQHGIGAITEIPGTRRGFIDAVALEWAPRDPQAGQKAVSISPA